MTIDGVIQNEENDGDGFKYGGWFFPFADEVTGAVVQERLAKPMDLLLGRKTFDGWEIVLADAFELLAELHDRNEIRRFEHTRLERLAAECIPQRRHRGKGARAQTTGRSRYLRHGQCRSASDAFQKRPRR